MPVPVTILRTIVTIIVVCICPLFALLVIRGPVDGQGDLGQGYWGDKSATVNWCEADYTVTIYCAELVNVLSSLTVSSISVPTLTVSATHKPVFDIFLQRSP
jgi:hypothetical protein